MNDDMAQNVIDLVTSNIDTLWVINSAILVFIMQAGFMCMETGLSRHKNSINVDIKNAADRYKESYGEVWTSQWSDWSGISKITGDTLSNPSFFGYKWEENKIVEILAIFSDDAFNKELAIYLEANKE